MIVINHRIPHLVLLFQLETMDGFKIVKFEFKITVNCVAFKKRTLSCDPFIQRRIEFKSCVMRVLLVVNWFSLL